MSGDWIKDKLRPSEASREVARARAPGMKKVASVVGAILFGTDSQMEKAIRDVEEGVEGEVQRARGRGGSIETTGEEVVDPVVDEPASKAPPEDDDDETRPLSELSAVTCKACRKRQPIARDPPRSSGAILDALLERGWRQAKGGGWRCPPCAKAPGAKHG